MVSSALRHGISRPEYYSRASIVSMSQKAYRSLNIDEFILANIGRYTKVSILATKRVFRRFDPDEIANDIFVEAKPQLLRIHRNNLNAKGARRAELLFMALKYCACRHVPSLLADRYGLRHEVRTDNKTRGPDADGLDGAPAEDPDPVFSAAENDPQVCEDTPEALAERAREEKNTIDRMGVWLSCIKDQVSELEYEILEKQLLDDKSIQEIADLLGTSYSCVKATRERMRRKIERGATPGALQKLRERYQIELQSRGLSPA